MSSSIQAALSTGRFTQSKRLCARCLSSLRSERKLFSNASLSYGDPPNTNVEPVDTAIPGSLPVLDPEAIRLGALTALALRCEINPRSTFDRKHYFYHDIPASYQITQRYNPLARNGSLQISKGDNNVSRDLLVKIQQLQIEQDTAKSQLVGSERLVDLNRAGAGLMEIVSDPDMRSAEEAGAFVRKLQSLLRRVGSGDGDMEKGNLRVDANVSVHKPGTPFGTRCEIKNLNSVRYLQQAIEYETKRHIAHYQSSSEPLPQETRTLNEITGETVPLRTKEDVEDYRYMPDCNLPAMVIKETYLDRLSGSLPELPWETVQRISTTYNAPRSDVETLLGLDEYNAAGVQYLEEIAQGDAKLGKRAMNWIVHETLGQLNKNNKIWTPETVPAALMRDMVASVENGRVTGTNAKALLRHVLERSEDGHQTLEALLTKLGIKTSDSLDLEAICQEVIDALPAVAKDVRGGQMKAVGRLMGEVMKRSGGAADARKAREVLMRLLQ